MPITDNHDNVTSVALRAIAVAQMRSHESVSLEHILAALLERPEIQKCLRDTNVDQRGIQTDLESYLDNLDDDPVIQPPGHLPSRTREFDVVIARTIAYSQISPRRLPNGLDVLFQIITFFENSFAASVLLKYGLNNSKLRNYIVQGLRKHHHDADYASETEPGDKAEAVIYIKKYCTNLNELAENGKIEPVVGRLSELDRIIQIIARKTKNNVALVGDPGVGKTAIVEGLAYNICKGFVPSIFAGSIVWSLDVGSLVAGTRFRGDFEERMKFLLKSFALLEDELPILFIDEIHTIMEAGSGAKGSLDVSNLLKPALARGGLRCIGSTTDRDWRQHFEKDRALLRRFKKMPVTEPSIEDAKLILKGVRRSYEAFHDVLYTDDALDAAVMLTSKYMHDGRLPDKAIDVIDEAGARHRVLGMPANIDVEAIEREVSLIVKLPVKLKQDEAVQLANLEQDMTGHVFGQDHAVQHLVDAVLISRAGLRDDHKPEGSYLFVGPTGVGKSELARQLALSLHLPLVKFDMSEYVEKHSVARLIGSPPGYVGYGDGAAGHGLLINAIDQTPSCILLLDEIEKAHPDLFNILLQVMEDAVLTSGDGKTVDFRNVILIMTSNVGIAGMERNGIGFLPSEAELDDAALKNMFTPEFRNRLDAVIKFDALDKKSISRIVQKFIDLIRQQVDDRGVTIEISDAAKKWLVEHGHDPIYGARPLRRLIAERIKRPLSRLLLFSSLRDGGTARIAVSDHELIVTVSQT